MCVCVNFSFKWIKGFCHQLLHLMMIQTCMAFFLLWNIKEDIRRKVSLFLAIKQKSMWLPSKYNFRVLQKTISGKTSSVSAVVFRNKVPLLLTAQFVGCVLIPVTCEVQLTGKDVYSVANKQILWMKLIKLGPAQEGALVLHIKLYKKSIRVNVWISNIARSQGLKSEYRNAPSPRSHL